MVELLRSLVFRRYTRGVIGFYEFIVDPSGIEPESFDCQPNIITIILWAHG